jgi:hypothetical protein
MKKLLLLFCIFLAPLACSSQSASSSPSTQEVHDFDSCVAAGNPMLKMLPPKCVDRKTGKHYVGAWPGKGGGNNSNGEEVLAEKNEKGLCKNACGNGTCEQMVCMGEGCPCAETPASCPDDCALQF